jgi:hypothetical protein
MPIGAFFGPLFDRLKRSSYWPAIEPIFIFLSLYTGACVLGYEYLQSRFANYSPEFAGISLRLLTLFLHSYVFKQITLVAAAIGVATMVIAYSVRKREATHAASRVVATAKAHGREVARAAVFLILLAGVTIPAFRWLAPRTVGDIEVLFLDDPGTEFDQAALAYVLYELNARQSRWHFDVNFDVYNPRAWPEAAEQCAGDIDVLCRAERQAAGRALIAITTRPLESSYHFWQNRGNVSVITTDDWKPYAPPSVYEYLTYSIILQSILIHLNTACPALPSTQFQEQRVGIGDLFEFAPRRYGMKPAILAAHMSPGQEIMLMNCFGADYVDAAAGVITLDWLRSDPVKRNLESNFKVTIANTASR